MNTLSNKVSCAWDVRATLGEGPVWCADECAVWFVDIKQQHILRFDTKTNQGRRWHAPSPPGFLAPIDAHTFIVGLKSGLHRFDSNNDTFIKLREVEPESISNRLNDGHVDVRGRLWFGSMDDDERATSGALYRLDNGSTLACLDRDICITNGPCVSADGRTFYHTDTVNRVIHAFDLHADGSLTNKHIFARFESSEGHPDGSIVDSDNCVWTGMWGGWSLLRLSPEGERIGEITLPCANVTKAVFGGIDLKTLYITTARKGLNDAQLADQPLAGGLFSVDVAVAGLPSHRVNVDA